MTYSPTTLQDIMLKYLPSYPHLLSLDEAKALTAISDCRTERMGISFIECPECGDVVIHYQSCRNRHCPQCQRIEQEIWLDKAKTEIVDAPYFHVVFTVPHYLNGLFYKNKKTLYTLIMKCSAQTLIELAEDHKFLSATPSVLAMLHTWGADLKYHVHTHCLVSGAGLTDDDRFIVLETTPGKDTFFIPAAVLKKKFKGKFLAGLATLFETNELKTSDKFHVKSFLNQLYKAGDWCVHIKETMNGKGNAVEYFARYVKRVAITNSRIKSISGDFVTFVAKDYTDDGKKCNVTITGHQFIKRFSQHILPKGFQRVRRYGFLNNRSKSNNLRKIAHITRTLMKTPRFEGMTRTEIVIDICGKKIVTCNKCGHVGTKLVPVNSPEHKELYSKHWLNTCYYSQKMSQK